MTKRTLFFALPLTLALVGAACAQTTDAPSGPDAEAPARRQKIGKADLFGNCATDDGNSCGTMSNGNCWCDAACSGFGDCCADYEATCTEVDTCAPVTCKIACPNGFATGSDGCEVCACKEVPNAMCGGFANIQCPAGKVCAEDPNDDCDPEQGGADCSGICVDAPQNTCENKCGGPAADLSCYCDEACVGYGDCCGDYDAHCVDDREPASGQCVKNSNETCSTDADCVAGGCGGELCYNPAFGGGISTCECGGPGAPVTGCGCVAGHCSWYN